MKRTSSSVLWCCPGAVRIFTFGSTLNTPLVPSKSSPSVQHSTLPPSISFARFGDGWNGAEFTWSGVGDDAGSNPTTITTGTLDEGHADTQTVCASGTHTCYTFEVSGGSWPSEITWSMNALGQSFNDVPACEVGRVVRLED